MKPEVSNEVAVTPGVLTIALGAVPVGSYYTNYPECSSSDSLVLQDNWIITIAPHVCL